MALSLDRFFTAQKFGVLDGSVETISKEQIKNLKSATVVAGTFKPQACLIFNDGRKCLMTLGRDTLANAEVGDKLKKSTIKTYQLSNFDGTPATYVDKNGETKQSVRLDAEIEEDE